MPQTRAAPAPPRAGHPTSEEGRASLTIGLSAVIVAASISEPRILTVPQPARQPADAAHTEGVVEALPSGPLEAQHRTLEIGLRSWVEQQTGQRLGYVEQLYTFGDRDRVAGEEALALPALVVAYLALVREVRPAAGAEWRNWYRYFPWEDWRDGKPLLLTALEARLEAWAAMADGEAERRLRHERLGLAFGLHGAAWNEELVLERYELLYEAGLVAEAARDVGGLPQLPDGSAGAGMASDHRRILATAIGRLRGKIKYRPVVFELMMPAFTLLQLQRTIEALSGVRLHKQNFRRLVEQQGLVEETGEISAQTGGRPARLVRFRREVLLERPAPGLRLRAARRSTG
ncbi:MAG: NUDIX hydrolase [Thiohalocapsa sp.]